LIVRIDLDDNYCVFYKQHRHVCILDNNIESLYLQTRNKSFKNNQVVKICLCRVKVNSLGFRVIFRLGKQGNCNLISQKSNIKYVMVLISKRVNKYFNIKQSIIICTLFLVKYEYY